MVMKKDVIFNNTETKTEQKENDDNKISEETKKELLYMVGLDEAGYPIGINDGNIPIVKTFVKNENNKFIGKINGLLEFFMIYFNGNDEKIIADYYDDNSIKYLIWFAAAEYDLLKENLLNIDNHPEYITAGSTGREGIKKDDYKKIAKIYNLPNDGSIIFNKSIDIYEDYYVLEREYSLAPYYQIESNASFEIVNHDTILNYYIKANEINNDGSINKHMKYTFKQYDDGTYYLYSVYVKNN